MALGSTQKPVGVALIGAGMIAKTHIAALSALRDVATLRTILSQSPDRARPLAVHYAGAAPEFTSDLARVVADPAIDMAIVATPPNVRHEVIAPLANAGKHILLEKPMGRTVTEAQEVVAICENAGVALGVVFQHRMRASSIAAAKLVASGALGPLGLVEIAVPLWRDQSYYDERGRGTYARDGGGVLLTNAIHSFDLALSLTGPVTHVQAMTATTSLHQLEAEDFATGGLRFACGAVGSFTASTAMFPHRTEVIRLHFANGSLRIDKDGLDASWRDGRKEHFASSPPTDEGLPFQGEKHAAHQAVIADFITAIRTGHKPIVTGHEAMAPHTLIDAIERSSRTGKIVQM